MSKIIVKLDNISKTYYDKYIIKNLDMDIYEGEFITLLGPSGCGKTTILRMISGLEQVTNGNIYIDGENVTNIDPTKREVNTIFQNLALFPTMNVRDNISFGLRMKKISKIEIKKRVDKIIKLVKLEGLEDRLPSQLSGGQQQRVAIARGVIMNPKVLLLDESLCSLDLKLKKQMQIELKKIQKQLGLTFIYVTHNQDEALTMSDRIAIINNGDIEQLDTPQNIYQYPISTFVADFIGESNIINGTISEIKNDIAVLKNEFLEINLFNKDYKINDRLNIMIRPENVDIYNEKKNDCIEAVVTDIIYDGATTKIIVLAKKQVLKINIDSFAEFKKDDKVYVKFDRKFIVPIIRNNYEKKE